MQLPQDFLDEMKKIMADDYDAFAGMTEGKPFRGITVNRLKADPERLLPLLPFETKKSPFYRDGYYICGEAQGIGNHPLHHAGAFYVQEPSASSAVALLDPQPGDRVLDLCAAPGGKSAQIASCLKGRGLLWTNEIVKNRANILLSNIERMGVRNAVVSSCHPETLCGRLEGYFDKALVDAPCSGEGMFRKEPQAVTEWSREHVRACAERQLSILDSAASAVRPGGTLVYSTCTFSTEENEGVIRAFLKSHPGFEPADVNEPFGRPSGVSCGVRITPLEGGEGHFAAKLKKTGDSAPAFVPDLNRSSGKKDSRIADSERELADLLTEPLFGSIMLLGDKVLIIPSGLPDCTGLGVIRSGVLAGSWVKDRFDPAHALFMSSKPSGLRRVLELSLDDERVEAFLRGMEIDCPLSKGYTAVSVEGMTIGFGKCSGVRLKNKYPKGLRLV